jgi:hypothetical protein
MSKSLKRTATHADVFAAIAEGRLRIEVETGNVFTRRPYPKASWHASALENVQAKHQKTPYKRFSFSTSNGPFRCLLHRAVWFVAKGDIPSMLEVNHKNGDKSRNGIDNLEVVTSVTNMEHARATGLIVPASGIRCNKARDAKLSVVAVLAIRASTDTQEALAIQYGKDQGSISRIRNRIAYAWI